MSNTAAALLWLPPPLQPHLLVCLALCSQLPGLNCCQQQLQAATLRYLWELLKQLSSSCHGARRVVHADAVGRGMVCLICPVAKWRCTCEQCLVIQHWRQLAPLLHNLQTHHADTHELQSATILEAGFALQACVVSCAGAAQKADMPAVTWRGYITAAAMCCCTWFTPAQLLHG